MALKEVSGNPSSLPDKARSGRTSDGILDRQRLHQFTPVPPADGGGKLWLADGTSYGLFTYRVAGYEILSIASIGEVRTMKLVLSSNDSAETIELWLIPDRRFLPATMRSYRQAWRGHRTGGDLTTPDSRVGFAAIRRSAVIEARVFAAADLDGDTVDHRTGRALATPGQHLLDLPGAAGDHGLDAAVAAVAHPAVDAQQAGLRRHRIAEADALYQAGDDQAANFHHRLAAGPSQGEAARNRSRLRRRTLVTPLPDKGVRGVLSFHLHSGRGAAVGGEQEQSRRLAVGIGGGEHHALR